jgi:hypothetical protein
MPNGVCNCSVIYSPYNNTKIYTTWKGDDCSYITPYTAANSAFVGWINVLLPLLIAFFVEVAYPDFFVKLL